MWVGWYVVIFLVVAGPLALIALLAPSGQKKDIIDIAQAIVTTSAIIVGGIWVWQEFTRERQGVPWLAMRQEITSFQIPEDQYVLHIQTRLSNTGKTRAEIGNGFTKIQQVFPLDERLDQILNDQEGASRKYDKEIIARLFASKNNTLDWTTICQRSFTQRIVMEPNEDHVIDQDFLIPDSILAVRIYTYVDSPGGDEIGYESSTIHWLKDRETIDGNTEDTAPDSHRFLCNIDPEPSTSASADGR